MRISIDTSIKIHFDDDEVSFSNNSMSISYDNARILMDMLSKNLKLCQNCSELCPEKVVCSDQRFSPYCQDRDYFRTYVSCNY